jgi:hypothetical protein
MKRVFVLFAFLAVFTVMTGCSTSGRHLPGMAMKDPAQAVSVKAPEQLEAEGKTHVTTFTAVMDPGLWTEVVAGSGVWPALAQTPEGELKKGYAYLSSVNYWGDFLLKFIFAGDEYVSEHSRILYFNRDAGWAYTLEGEEINGDYDPGKFDSNEEYQKELFTEFGMTISGLDRLWLSYLRDRGLDPSDNLSSVHYLEIGKGEGWQDFKEKLAGKMKHKYKIGEKQVRISHLPEQQFKQVAVSIPGFGGTDRFIKRAKLPLVALPFTGVGAIAASGASVLSSAVTASIDDDWSGFYGRAQVLRHELAPVFRDLCRVYKSLLRQRDGQIRELKQELENKRQTINWQRQGGKQ